MGKRGRPAKTDKFQDLDNEFKDAVAAMATEDINKKISDVAKNQEAVDEAKKADPQLAEAKEAVKVAGAGYKEATKMNRLRIQYAMRVLGDRGQP
jgi:hypothetical protein